jgi:hypothetical protein
MRRWLMAIAVTVAGAAGLGAAVGASADTPRATTTTPTTTTNPGGTSTQTTPTPAPPAKGSLQLYLRDNFNLGHTQVTVPGRTIHVEGTARPYVAGQHVTMRVYLGKRLIHTYRLRIRSAKGGKYGTVSYPVTSPGAGTVRIVVQHAASPQLRAFSADHSFEVLNPQAGFGSRSDFVRLIQQRLVALHLYLPQTGVYDSGTGLAMDAYHRLLGWGTYQTLDQRTVNALLDGQGSFKVRDPGAGRHAEGNLSDQLLALINGSHVYRIFPIGARPCVLQSPRLSARRHVLLGLLLRWLRDPRLQPRARLPRQPRMHAAPDRRRYCGLRLAGDRRRRRQLPLGR